MWDYLERTALVIGEDRLKRLSGSRAALLGLGGVGSAAAEALCRMGVGHMLLIDGDSYSLSNLNRQLYATRETVGQPKTEAARRRLLSINPAADIDVYDRLFLPEDGETLFGWRPDVVLDAIDTVTTKLYLAEECTKRGVALVSCVGTGNRIDPTKLAVGDIAQTAGNGCPLARVMRRELKKRGVDRLTVVYSAEPPAKGVCAEAEKGRHSPGSTALVPPVAGYFLAHAALEALTGAG